VVFKPNNPGCIYNDSEWPGDSGAGKTNYSMAYIDGVARPHQNDFTLKEKIFIKKSPK
jgi:hypothetical protein